MEFSSGEKGKIGFSSGEVYSSRVSFEYQQFDLLEMMSIHLQLKGLCDIFSEDRNIPSVFE